MISPHDPKTIYYGGNHLFKSTDRGDTWEVLGEDLTIGTRIARSRLFSACPVDEHTLSRNDGVAAWPCITAIAESPVKAGVLWVGTDDGNLQMSRDGGKTWTNVVVAHRRNGREADTSAASSRRIRTPARLTSLSTIIAAPTTAFTFSRPRITAIRSRKITNGIPPGRGHGSRDSRRSG